MVKALTQPLAPTLGCPDDQRPMLQPNVITSKSEVRIGKSVLLTGFQSEFACKAVENSFSRRTDSAIAASFSALTDSMCATKDTIINFNPNSTNGEKLVENNVLNGGVTKRGRNNKSTCTVSAQKSIVDVLTNQHSSCSDRQSLSA